MLGSVYQVVFGISNFHRHRREIWDKHESVCSDFGPRIHLKPIIAYLQIKCIKPKNTYFLATCRSNLCSFITNDFINIFAAAQQKALYLYNVTQFM
jgi:hypothetical protein